jgi:hypothetical protein
MQTSIIKKTLLATVMLLCLGIAAPSAQAIESRGARSCGVWMSDKAKFSVAHEAWLVGFLTGMALYSDKDILKGTDNESIFLWIDNYCRANPLHNLTRAGDALFEELVKQKRL